MTNRKFVFIENNDHIEDFHLMSMMKNHIISNSCYSWWAAYLSKESKTIIAPNNIGVYHFYVNENIYLPDWILVDPNLDESYPTDMCNYDFCSQSIDTQ